MKMSEFNDHQREKFLRCVKTDESGCWIWQKSSKASHGYGQTYFNGKVLLAHRVAYAMFKGDIPEGLFVRHSNKCTSRACCNPDHLTLGTHADNMQDVRDTGYEKVVTGKGEEHYNAILTEQTVVEARRRVRRDREAPAALAREYGVGISVLNKALRGVTWGHVPDPITEDELPSLKMKLRRHEVLSIREEIHATSASALAKRYGVTTGVITKTVTGELWGNVPGALGEDYFKNRKRIRSKK